MNQPQGPSGKSDKEIINAKLPPFEEFNWKEYFDRYKQAQKNASYLGLTELANNVDEKIATEFLSRYQYIKDEMNKSGHCRVNGLSGEKWLRVEKNQLNYNSHCSSLNKCTAACAYWIIKNFSKEEIDGGPLRTVSCDIPNTLANRQGLARRTDLYYIYNAGLEYMIAEFPLQTTVLLAWRHHYRERIFWNPKIKGPIGDTVVGFVRDYYYSQAEAANLSIDEYFGDLIGKMDGYMKHLRGFDGNIIPFAQPGSKALRNTEIVDMLTKLWERAGAP